MRTRTLTPKSRAQRWLRQSIEVQASSPYQTGSVRTRRIACAQSTEHSYLRFVVWWLMATMMLVYVGATTLTAQLASTYSSCYDPTGSSCSCTSIELDSQGLPGTIPTELSACTDVATLYVVPIVTRSCCPSPQLVLLPIDNSCLSCPRCVGRRGMVA